MKISTIIFDWDGTIGKTLHLWLAGYRQALQNQGHTIIDSVIARDFFYEHDKGQLKYPDIDFVKMIDETREYVFSHLDDLELYIGAKETIIQLYNRDITLSLVSSSGRQLLEKGLDLHGLTKYFSSVISGDDVTKHKPNPEAFRQTFDLLQKDSVETLIIGDAKTDILAGQAALATTCLFTPTENELFYDFDVLRSSQPHHNINEIKDLLKIID